MRICIELPSWLGDSVMTTPAIENLISFYKDPEITLIGSKVSIEVFSFHPLVVNKFIFEKKYLNLFKFSKNLDEFDVFFSFRSSLSSKCLKLLINSKNKFQFDHRRNKNCHQVDKYNNFINESLGVSKNAKELLIHRVKAKKKGNKKLLGINPGASYGSAKRWYPEEFAAVAVYLSNKYDIIIFGGENEKNIASDIENFLVTNRVDNYLNLAGKTSILDLISEIENLDLFITGDSGPMHLAAAFQVPTISIFGPTDHKVTSQWMNEKNKILKKNLNCQPCMKRQCPLKHHNCMKDIKASEVLKAVKLINC